MNSSSLPNEDRLAIMPLAKRLPTAALALDCRQEALRRGAKKGERAPSYRLRIVWRATSIPLRHVGNRGAGEAPLCQRGAHFERKARFFVALGSARWVCVLMFNEL